MDVAIVVVTFRQFMRGGLVSLPGIVAIVVIVVAYLIAIYFLGLFENKTRERNI